MTEESSLQLEFVYLEIHLYCTHPLLAMATMDLVAGTISFTQKPGRLCTILQGLELYTIRKSTPKDFILDILMIL